MMKVFRNILLALLILGVVLASTLVQSAEATNEELRQLIEKTGHDPSLSPEQARKLVREGRSISSVASAAKARASTVVKEKAAEPLRNKKPRVISREELLANVNKHGHDPSLSPEQIYKRIREENGE